jgi:hypothetical protein
MKRHEQDELIDLLNAEFSTDDRKVGLINNLLDHNIIDTAQLADLFCHIRFLNFSKFSQYDEQMKFGVDIIEATSFRLQITVSYQKLKRIGGDNIANAYIHFFPSMKTINRNSPLELHITPLSDLAFATRLQQERQAKSSSCCSIQ